MATFQPREPRNEARLWRYLDLAKFEDLLQSRSLYFARADKLGDPFEGTPPELMSSDALAAEFKKKSPSLSDAEAARMAQEMRQKRQDFRDRSFVSCWHKNDHESAAMWELYGGGASICIQTTYSAWKECLGNTNFPHSYFGLIEYIDYSRAVFDEVNLPELLFHKRASFAHEREVRAVLCKAASDAEEGVRVGVQLDQLIKAVLVSPLAPASLKGVVDGLLATYRLDGTARHSSLASDPVW